MNMGMQLGGKSSVPRSSQLESTPIDGRRADTTRSLPQRNPRAGWLGLPVRSLATPIPGVHPGSGIEYISPSLAEGESRMSMRATVRISLLIAATLLLGCQTPSSSLSTADDVRPKQSVIDAYRAYALGDCESVEMATTPIAIEAVELGEVRHSLILLHGFCQEHAGDVDAAIETYRSLVRDAPLSFASGDARERLRILRLLDRDPDYLGWVETSRERATQGRSDRKPLERSPADFPPLAREAGIEGFAVVTFGVTRRGDTDSPVVVDSRPPLLFDGTAVRAVREWRYAKGRDDSEEQRQVIRLVFKLDEGEAPPSAPPNSSNPSEASVRDAAGGDGVSSPAQ